MEQSGYTVTCPRAGCGRTLSLDPKPDCPDRLIGRCTCGEFQNREVIEMDATTDPKVQSPAVVAEKLKQHAQNHAQEKTP